MKIYRKICLISNFNNKIIRQINLSKKAEKSLSFYHTLKSKEIKHLDQSIEK